MNVLLLALMTLAPVSAPDTLARFRASCEVQSTGAGLQFASFTAPCLIEDQGAPELGFNNRFRILIASPQPLELSDTADYIRVQDLPGGAMRITAILWGSILVTPAEGWIREAMNRQAPEYEVRPQNITVRRLDDATLEVSIVERQADWTAHGVGSAAWELRHRASIELLGRAK